MCSSAAGQLRGGAAAPVAAVGLKERGKWRPVVVRVLVSAHERAAAAAAFVLALVLALPHHMQVLVTASAVAARVFSKDAYSLRALRNNGAKQPAL